MQFFNPICSLERMNLSFLFIFSFKRLTVLLFLGYLRRLLEVFLLLSTVPDHRLFHMYTVEEVAAVLAVLRLIDLRIFFFDLVFHPFFL